MQLYASQGWQGMVLQPDATIGMRVKELATELGIAWMPGVTPIMDENNNLLQPMVTLGTKYQADLANNWLFDNYKTYWGDIELDPSPWLLCMTSPAPYPQNRLRLFKCGVQGKYPAASDHVLNGTASTPPNRSAGRRGL
jgi:hypothetical protein